MQFTLPLLLKTPKRKPRKPHPLKVALRRLGWSQDRPSMRWSHPDHPRRDGGCVAHGFRGALSRCFHGYTLNAAARRAGLLPR